MKLSDNTLIAFVVSNAVGLIGGVGSVIWWLSGLQNKVNNVTNDVEEIKDDRKIEKEKTNKHTTDIAVIMSRLDTIIDLLKNKNVR